MSRYVTLTRCHIDLSVTVLSELTRCHIDLSVTVLGELSGGGGFLMRTPCCQSLRPNRLQQQQNGWIVVSYGCLNIFVIICDNYGDVWKVHQTNVTNPSENGGRVASLKITLHVSQQDALHIPKHTPLQGVPSGTHTHH